MIPVITVTRNAMKEIPPRQYSGYQYQTVFSSYFSVWERGSWRCTVSTLWRVTSAQGTVGKRSLIQPKRKRLPRPTGSRGRSFAMGSPAEGRIPFGEVVVADERVPLEVDGDGGETADRRPVDVARADVPLPVGVLVPPQGHRVVLGIVALAPDRVLPVEERLGVREVVLEGLGDGL